MSNLSVNQVPLLNCLVQADNGTAAAPTLSFFNAPTNGFYLQDSGTIAMAIGGTKVASWNSSGPTISGDIDLSDGTLALPSLAFTSAQSTGLFYDGSNGIKLGTNGVLALQVNSSQAAAFAGALTTVGTVGLGGAVSASGILNLGATNPLAGTAQAGAVSAMAGTSAATASIIGFLSNPTTAAASFVCGLESGFYSTNVTKGAGSTITRQVGYYAEMPTQGGTGNAILADGSAFSGNFGINLASANANSLGGALTLAPTSNQLILGVTNTTTITAPAPASSRVYTIPDAGGAANFLMSAGTTTVAGAYTYSAALTLSAVSNQLVLGVTNTTTISSTAPASSRTYTIPDAGGAANFLMSAGTTTVSGAYTYSAALTLSAASNQLVINPGAHKFTITGAAPAADVVYTIPDAGGAANFVMTAGTTQSIAGTVTFTGQLIGTGTATNDNAAATRIGETLVQSRLKSAATGATTATSLNITSSALSLTAGDWDVSGAIGFLPAATTSVTLLKAAISKTSATLPATDTLGVPTSGEVTSQFSTAANVMGANDFIVPLQTTRISLAGTTNIFLVAQATFTVSTLTVYGSINARRVR